MPIYDLRCGKCGHEFESANILMSEAPTDDEPAKCPKCGKKKVRVFIKKAAAYLNRYSPMHPRRSRGMGFRKGY